MIKIHKSLERMNSKRDEWRDTLKISVYDDAHSGAYHEPLLVI